MKPVLIIILIISLGSFSFINRTDAVQKIMISEINGNPIWKFSGQSPFFYKSRMSIDADGAPDAYHPDNIGRDNLINAGKKGNWWALVTHNGKRSGIPVIQGQGDPCPGYYISTTALEDTSKAITDPGRYVDSSKIPYIALPPSVKGLGKAGLGDFTAVINLNNGKVSYAIFADIGPDDSLGEGSIALAEALGIPSSPRKGGTGTEKCVIYLVFPGSGNGKARPLDQIKTEGERLFQDWGGMARVKEIFSD